MNRRDFLATGVGGAVGVGAVGWPHVSRPSHGHQDAMDVREMFPRGRCLWGGLEFTRP